CSPSTSSSSRAALRTRNLLASSLETTSVRWAASRRRTGRTRARTHSIVCPGDSANRLMASRASYGFWLPNRSQARASCSREGRVLAPCASRDRSQASTRNALNWPPASRPFRTTNNSFPSTDRSARSTLQSDGQWRNTSSPLTALLTEITPASLTTDTDSGEILTGGTRRYAPVGERKTRRPGSSAPRVRKGSCAGFACDPETSTSLPSWASRFPVAVRQRCVDSLVCEPSDVSPPGPLVRFFRFSVTTACPSEENAKAQTRPGPSPNGRLTFPDAVSQR